MPVLLALGLIFAGLAGFWAWKSWSFATAAQAAAGKIVGFERRESTRHRSGRPSVRRTTFFPVFTFRDSGGKEHKVTSGAGQDEASYRVGQEVAVLYDPASPGDARLNTFSQMWLGPALLGTIGSVFLVLRFLGRRAEDT